MRRYIVSSAAQQDIEAILAWTQEHFGEEARLRYKAVVVQGLNDLAEDPGRVGTQVRSEIDSQAHTYHLRHSRHRVKRSIGRVKSPRHFLLFRIQEDGSVEIVRVFHDRMDLGKQLAEEYRAFTEDDDLTAPS